MATRTVQEWKSAISGDFQWTLSTAVGATNEYYLEASGGGDPGIAEPGAVREGSTTLAVGTVGSLTAGQWDWGDNETVPLGFNTVYIETTGSVDPDTLGYKGIEYREDTSETFDRTPIEGAPSNGVGGPTTPVTVAQNDFSVELLAANSQRTGFRIDNESGQDIYWVESATQPTNINQMMLLADKENYFSIDKDGQGKLWVYQNAVASLDVHVVEHTK